MEEKDPAVNEQFRQLRWQCRRGIKEVEVLLVPFFENRFVSLTAEQREKFNGLLEQTDVELFAWFMESEKPPTPPLQEMVDLILRYARNRGEGCA